MLAHENGGMRVVQDIAGEMGQLSQDFASNVGMSLGCNKDGQAWRSLQSHEVIPRGAHTPWLRHHARVSHDTQKFIQD